MDYEPLKGELTSELVTAAVLSSAMLARYKVDQGTSEDAAYICSDFINVMAESGLIQIDNDEMEDLEVIERAMYAANLFLASCAVIGKAHTKRNADVEHLNRSLGFS